MKNRQLIDIYEALQHYTNRNDLGSHLTYVVARNLRLLAPEVEALESVKQPKGALKTALAEYQREFNTLAMEHAEKDEKGRPIAVNPNNYKVADPTAWHTAVDALDLKHSETLSQIQALHTQYTDMLKQPSAEVALRQIPLSAIPEGVVTAGDMAALLDHVITEETTDV